jgi:tRNA splicing endonuclease
MKHLKKFNQSVLLKEEAKSEDKVYRKEEIESFIDKNKKNKSSYEMYKMLRDKGYKENDLKEYFHDNY